MVLKGHDSIESKLSKKPQNICSDYFSNKAVEPINSNSLINNTKLFPVLKDFPCHFVTLTVVYNL